MKPIYQAWFCHIEVTNFCEKSCVYCSRWTRHLRPDQYFYMTLDEIDAALETLIPSKKSATAWPSRIGIQGGEPTLHPQFEQICQLLLKRATKAKYGLWTYGGKRFNEYKGLIDKTFGMLAYNEHNEDQKKVCKHQPATIAIGEAVIDKKVQAYLIDNCFVQLKWCPTIAQDKAHFCEVAYGIDRLLELRSGWPAEYNWFMKTPDEFKDQVNACCFLCGMPIPIERQLLCNNKERITPKLLKRMQDLNLAYISDKYVEVFDKKLTVEELRENAKTWDPRNFRGDRQTDNPFRYGIKL